MSRIANRNSTTRFTFVLAMAIVCCVPLNAQTTFAQHDVVITKRTSKKTPRQHSTSASTAKRKGTIVEWKGLSLTILSNGTQREIDNETIVQVQTAWGEDYIAGVNAIETGDFRTAISKLQAALSSEPREWAKQIIRSKLVETLAALEQHGAAAEQFLLILSNDPNTRFIHLAPLPWAGAGTALNQPAQKWMQSNNPTVQLLGASWLLVGAGRQKAISTLDGLARDIDPNVQNLAIAQLWRSRTNTNAKQTAVWQTIVDEMPRSLRAGPQLVLADAQAKTGQSDQALVNLMRIPILYPEQKSLAAAALYNAGKLLRASGKTTQSQTVFNELKTRYPQTIWAQQAAQSLQLK